MLKRYSVFLGAIVFLSCVVLCGAVRASACDVTEYSLDAAAPWSRWDTLEHMGSPNTTYTYANSTADTKYSSCVTAGINAWGVFISCTETDTNPKGTIGYGYYTDNVLATTYVSSGTNKHITSWQIEINARLFDVTTASVKEKTISHEIGHVYGLGHVTDSTQIMYSSVSENVAIRNDDCLGMKVVTHCHAHNFGYIKETTSHRRQCSSCKLYERSVCTYTHFHSGNFHYFKINCTTCGNNRTVKQVCSGPPCDAILYSIPVEYATE